MKVCMLPAICMCCLFTKAQPVKILAECTVSFAVSIDNGSSYKATKTLYIKGKKARTEISTPAFNQTTIYDNSTGNAIVIKEIAGDKYVTRLSADEWKAKNSRWNGISIQLTGDTKSILGYICKKAIATTKEGKQFTMYYAAAITPTASENPYQFKTVPGLVLEYESETADGKNVSYTATNINLSPVPAAKFILPTSGYRTL